MSKIYTYLILAIAIITATHCTKESNEFPAIQETTISFFIDDNGENTKSSTGLLENEKKIDKLDIFIYNSTGELCLYYPTSDQITIDPSTTPMKITCIVPVEKMSKLIKEEECQVYCIANSQINREDVENITLDNLKLITHTNTTDYLFNTDTPPNNFLMQTDVIKGVKFEDELAQNLGKLTLKRAAAKIVLDILSTKIEGYKPGNVKIRIVNYLNKTVINSSAPQYTAELSDYEAASKNMIAENTTNFSYHMDPVNPIYTYINSWTSNNAKETYLVIEMDCINESTLENKTYYYKLPISYIDNNNNRVNELVRNYLYQYEVNISGIGGSSPEEAININGNINIIDWNTQEIATSILSYHYLFIYNPNAKLQNKDTQTWEYKSSLPITIIPTKVYSYVYKPDGTIETINYQQGSLSYPKITINPATNDSKTTFTLKSKVPINYVPLYIELNVTNAANLTQKATLVIYPKQYVTAEFSTVIKDRPAGSYTTPTGNNRDVGINYPEGVTTQKNFNFFTVTTNTLDIQDEMEGYRIGDPTNPITHPGAYITNNADKWTNVSPYYQTLKSVEENKIISPQFVIATHRGISEPDKTWLQGQKRCNTYREGKYPAGTWRMPTLAELKIIRKMQLDDNSAIKNLFYSASSLGWWSSQEYTEIVIKEQNEKEAIKLRDRNYNSTSVRCVHDVWRDK